MRKRLVALCLAVLMLIGLLPVATAEGLQAEIRSYTTYFGSLDATLTDQERIEKLEQLADNEVQTRDLKDAKQNEIQQLIEKITIIEKIVEDEREKAADLENQLKNKEL